MKSIDEATDRPPPARHWLEAATAGVASKGDDPGSVRLHVRGSICRAPGGTWMAWEGQQSFATESIGFRWRARIRLARLAWVDAEDRLDAAGGYGGAKLYGLIPVGSATGPDVTRSQLVRSLAELAFVPLVAARVRGLVWAADGADAFTPVGTGDRCGCDRSVHRRCRWRHPIGPITGPAP